ncbi:MAG: hypothetical protein ABSH46_14495 [Bryobacteraceae bacterium]|jgi:hypothetical protein
MELRWLFTPVMLAALGTASASAQSPETLQVNVPFTFTINNVYMPAGEYSIGRPGIDNSGLLVMRSSDGRHTAFFMGSAAARGSAPAQSSLVFRHEGFDYSLADIWWAGSTTGLQLPPSKESPSTTALHPPEVMVVMYR